MLALALPVRGPLPAPAVAGCHGPFDEAHPPGACWRPFSDRSPFNRPLPRKPRQAGDSAAVAAAVASWGSGPRIVSGVADTADDFGHPIYFSARSNPSFRVDCVEFGGDCELDGERVRIPNLARPAAGGDAHMAVIDQRHGVEYDFYDVITQASRRRPPGGRLGRGDEDRRRALEGTRRRGDRGRVRAQRRDHPPGGASRRGDRPRALHDRPVHARVQRLPDRGREPGPPARAATRAGPRPRRWVSASTSRCRRARSNALPGPRWERTILQAMRRYGMFVGDTGGGGDWGIQFESPSSFTSFGLARSLAGPRAAARPRPVPGERRHHSLRRGTCGGPSTGRPSCASPRRASATAAAEPSDPALHLAARRRPTADEGCANPQEAHASSTFYCGIGNRSVVRSGHQGAGVREPRPVSGATQWRGPEARSDWTFVRCGH